MLHASEGYTVTWHHSRSGTTSPSDKPEPMAAYNTAAWQSSVMRAQQIYRLHRPMSVVHGYKWPGHSRASYVCTAVVSVTDNPARFIVSPTSCAGSS